MVNRVSVTKSNRNMSLNIRRHGDITGEMWLGFSHLRVDTKNLGTLRACKLLECGIIMSQYLIMKNIDQGLQLEGLYLSD